MNDYRHAKRKHKPGMITAFEAAVLRQIFKIVLESGKAPSVTLLHKVFKTYRLRIVRTIGKLEEKDRLVRKKETGEIVSIYPLSLVPTEHQVIMEGDKTLFANCAVDALSIPHMFNKNAEIISQCHTCKETVTITVKNGEIVSKSHAHIYVWYPTRIERPAAVVSCPVINFFCSEEHVEAWKSENPQLAAKGQSKLLEKEYPHIKERWTRYGKMVGTR